MERRIKLSAVYQMLLTLISLEMIYCCYDGRGLRFGCSRFIMNVSNHSTANLNWIGGDVVSMMKSRYFTDILYITTTYGGFYEFNTTDGSHNHIPQSSDLKVIDQLIEVNDSLILAVDESSNLIKLISNDNTSSDQTLLCRGTNCCLNHHSLCFESPELHLGKVAINPENPYHLYFVNGSRIQAINFDTQNNESKSVTNLQHYDAQSTVRQLTLDKNFTTLTAAVTHKSNVTNVIKPLSYDAIDLTSPSSETVGNNLTYAPPDVTSIVEIDGGMLVTLKGVKEEITLIDMVHNKTLQLCTPQNSTSILIKSQPDLNCKPIDVIKSITADKEYIYAVKGLKDRSLLIIHYSFEAESSPPQEKLETVTVHAENTDSGDGPKWLENAVAILGTVLSLIIIGVVCYLFFIWMRKQRQPSKRHTTDREQVSSNNIQDIELAEIATSHQQLRDSEVNSAVQQTTMDISLPEAAVEQPRERPLPPLPSSLVRDTAVEDIENYETPLSCVDPIIEIPPAPPPPCPGQSTAHKRSLVSSVPLQHSNEYSEQCDSSAHYCDKPRHTSDIHRARRTSPNMVLDPVLLQEALTAIQSTSNQRVSSVTLTDRGNERQVKFELMPQPVPTPEQEYLTIKDN